MELPCKTIDSCKTGTSDIGTAEYEKDKGPGEDDMSLGGAHLDKIRLSITPNSSSLGATKGGLTKFRSAGLGVTAGGKSKDLLLRPEMSSSS